MNKQLWNSGAPPGIGWWRCKVAILGVPNGWRWWNGKYWSQDLASGCSRQQAEVTASYKTILPITLIKWSDYWPKNARVKRRSYG